jgi:hypothetical protein
MDLTELQTELKTLKASGNLQNYILPVGLTPQKRSLGRRRKTGIYCKKRVLKREVEPVAIFFILNNNLRFVCKMESAQKP